MVKDGLMRVKLDIVPDHGMTRVWEGLIKGAWAQVGPIELDGTLSPLVGHPPMHRQIILSSKVEQTHELKKYFLKIKEKGTIITKDELTITSYMADQYISRGTKKEATGFLFSLFI